VSGAIWTISTSIGARVIGLVGTLALTRFLAPDVYGEVSLAAVVIQTAQMASTCGLSQYIVSKPQAGQEGAFHATFYFMALGLLAIGGVTLLGGPIGALVDAPGLAAFLPGLAVAGIIDRVATVQDRIQVRDMRFRAVGINRSLGELTYTLVTVGCAASGFGGKAVVIGTLARAIARFSFLTATTERRDWLAPCRITWARTKELFSFGVPMSVAAFAGFGSRRWDNLVLSSLFGPGVAGTYNLAYNLADIPATQIGESVGDVLVPSFAQMNAERRKAALVRSLTLLMLLVGPLAFGLGAVAPTIVAAFFDERWAGVWPMLVILSVLSVVRPISWIACAYLQVLDRPRTIMVAECLKTAALLLAIATLGRLGPLFACAAVGVAFGASSVAYVLVLRRVDGIAVRDLVGPIVRPLLACVPLVIAVVALRRGLAPLGPLWPALQLTIEILCGALVFVPSALLIAPRASRDLLGLLRGAMKRR
jgi:lipopolysaccharide exporter